ncbi:CD48 antigen-like [Lepisosteus oculatus]|uniref:CD48 antigen-like n=1 Tax=Lepisosteus oculatus TaxID=7918 RepID=UPI003718AF82
MSALMQIVMGVFVIALVGAETVTVIGFFGGTVTLESGKNENWTLSIVQWSISTKEPNIATLIGSKTITDSNKNYAGRVELNPTTGNLKIKNLRIEDGTKYNALIQYTNNEQQKHSIQLAVYEHIARPNITVKEKKLKDGSCIITLDCYVKSRDDFNFTWELQSENTACINKNVVDYKDNSTLTAIVTPNRKVTYKCLVHNKVSTEETAISELCTPDNEANEKNEKNTISKCSSVFLFIVIGIVCFIVGIFTGIYRKAIQKAALSLREAIQGIRGEERGSNNTIPTKEQLPLAGDQESKNRREETSGDPPERDNENQLSDLPNNSSPYSSESNTEKQSEPFKDSESTVTEIQSECRTVIDQCTTSNDTILVS